MKSKLTPRKVIAKLAGLFLAGYSAYYVLVLVRDSKSLPAEGRLISALVAVMFAVLALFLWTADIKSKDMRFPIVRRVSFIVALVTLLILKLRMVGKIIAYLDFSKLYTVFYDAAYFLTLVAMLILLIYFVFILKRLPLYPKASVRMPAAAAVLFLCCLALEAVLFFAYGIYTEASRIRTAVMRPVFYLGLTGLSAYFLFPPESN